MEYQLEEVSIETLYKLIDQNKIDLNPSYQRNFIWSTTNQKDLIDTILNGYPLPSFFIYIDKEGKYEMVDGQQRATTIYRFIKGIITSSKKQGSKNFNLVDKGKFLSYKLPVIYITNLSPVDSLKEFYVLINKKGMHLNLAEVTKSEYHDTRFLKLANEVLSYQNLIDLNLFSDAVSKRMNDRAFIEELLGFLSTGKSKDKKKVVQQLYSNDITDEEYNEYKLSFEKIIDKIHNLNSIKPIADTRYKQKNDFYTLFSFVGKSEDDKTTLEYQYKILLLLDGKDSEGRQFIRPSNEECLPLREYANNCITQSNSKSAREKRLSFFEAILRNANTERNEVLLDVFEFLVLIFGAENVKLRTIAEYELFDVGYLLTI